MTAKQEWSAEQSFITVQVYLNEGFEGGATRFAPEFEEYGEDEEFCCFDDNIGEEVPAPSAPRKLRQGFDVVPRTGSVLLFQHDCCHEGSLVTRGRKYTIRSDVMYTAKGPGHEYSERPIIARQLDDLY